jgi:catechol 2,3-dioxygenase-like lactoylglutathione lyase family enzyme
MMSRGTVLSGVLLLALAVLGFASAASAPADSHRPPPILGVANIGLRVSDLVKSKQFYNGKLGFDLAFAVPGPHGDRTSYFKVNDRQYIELTPDVRPGEDRLRHIGLETTDVRALRSYIAARGVRVPDRVERLPVGNLGFEITDPDGHHVQFEQYLNSSEDMKDDGKYSSPWRLSRHILHLGSRFWARLARTRSVSAYWGCTTFGMSLPPADVASTCACPTAPTGLNT